MNKFLKILRILLTSILVIIIFLTLYFILDRYIFNLTIKGISPVDINYLLIYLILPLTGLIIIIRIIEKMIIKKSKL